MPSIRPADVADLARVQAIVDAAYSMYVARIGKPPGPMVDDYAAHVRNHAIWVACDNLGEIGGLIVLVPEEDHLLLDNIAVDPAWQGKGVGRLLLDFADAEARRRGYAELRLYTNAMMTENVALYARIGWTETGRAAQAGFDRVFFRKAVSR